MGPPHPILAWLFSHQCLLPVSLPGHCPWGDAPGLHPLPSETDWGDPQGLGGCLKL